MKVLEIIVEIFCLLLMAVFAAGAVIESLFSKEEKKNSSKNNHSWEEMMKIYVSGKISGLERPEVVAKFEAISAELRKKGHSVFVPTILPEYSDVSHEDYLHIDFAMIDVCDAIYMLADWQKSIGARKELQYAADFRKEILYEDKTTKEVNFPIIYSHPDLGRGA